MPTTGLEKALEDCSKLIEGPGGLQTCLARYPDFAREIEAHFRFRVLLSESATIEPASPAAAAGGRRLLLSQIAIDATHRRTGVIRRLSMRVAGVLGGLAFVGAVTVAAGAATGGVNLAGSVSDLLESVGVSLPEAAKPHVDAVSQPGSGLPDLPPQAQAGASPQSDQPQGSPNGASSNAQASASAEHGDGVSSAVKDAADGSSPGPDRGEAVREAACAAARDRSTLPSPAQGAAPQNGNGADPCAQGNASAGQTAQGTAVGQGLSALSTPPVSAPPGDPGKSDPPGNGVGAPPANPGQGNPPVSAPPAVVPPLQSGTNPVGAPPSPPGQGPPDTITTGVPPDPGSGNPVGAPPNVPAGPGPVTPVVPAPPDNPGLGHKP